MSSSRLISSPRRCFRYGPYSSGIGTRAGCAAQGLVGASRRGSSDRMQGNGNREERRLFEGALQSPAAEVCVCVCGGIGFQVLPFVGRRVLGTARGSDSSGGYRASRPGAKGVASVFGVNSVQGVCPGRIALCPCARHPWTRVDARSNGGFRRPELVATSAYKLSPPQILLGVPIISRNIHHSLPPA